MNYEIYLFRAIKKIKKNRKTILEFDRRCELEGIGIKRRLRYMRFFTILNKQIKKPFTQINKKDAEDFLLFLKYSQYADATKSIMWIMFKKFSKFLKIGIVFEYLKLNIKEKYVTRDEILKREEIEEMIKTATTLQEKTYIGFLYGTGCRIGEMKNLKYKNIEFDDNGVIISLDGKTGLRTIRMWNYHEILRDYIKAYMKNNEDFVFSKTEKTISDKIKDVAKRTGIEKRVYPHLFRHSCASYLSKILTDQELKYYLGWSPDSKMARRYIHINGFDFDDKIIKLNTQQTSQNKNMLNNPDFQQFLYQAYQTWQKQQQAPIKSERICSLEVR